jgi:CRP-like cAMP-binding protein
LPCNPSRAGRLVEMTGLLDWPRNRLLLALPSRDLERLMAELEHVRCERSQTLIHEDSPLHHIFFPDSGVISVLAVYSDGQVIEMATIGREGCAGVQAVFGANSSSARYFVQLPGTSAKMSQSVATAYVQAFLDQVMISVACNGAHNVKERLARWLLMMRDRSDDDALPLTHGLLAEMLGVRRPTITTILQEFQRAGLVEPTRRRVTIRNRRGLMGESCECYELVRTRIARQLPKTFQEN